MSLEPGGRTDKYGNNYENKYLIKLLLRLIANDLTSVTVEPLGEDKDSVEYTSVSYDGKTWYYQCKGSNGTKDKWSTADLKKYDVFQRSKKILMKSPDNYYIFISPLHYGELDELCKRARTDSGAEELYKYQLTNKKNKKVFEECEKNYNLCANESDQLITLHDLLSRSFFETVPTGEEALLDLNDRVSLYFSGDSSHARSLLQNLVNSEELYGKPISAAYVINYMEQNGVCLRKHLLSETINVVISELNDLFYHSFTPINGRLIPRKVTDEIMDVLSAQRCVILHGKAGTGKSGCIQEIIQNLKATGIPYLVLKLDKQIPQASPDIYGKQLGLGQSPVYCLYHIAGKNPCVLIIDQLDSIRWMSQYSVNALDVCKQMLREVRALNRYESAKISVLMICRTFDLETDPGLSTMTDTGEEGHELWRRIQISALSSSDVISVVGSDYYNYPKNLQELLKTPSALYIWSKLNKTTDFSAAESARDLMQEWWKQILERCNKAKIDKGRITSLKNKIVKSMIKKSSLCLRSDRFSDDMIEIDLLVSEGLLLNDNRCLSFSHQSFFDFFATKEMFNRIDEDATITDIIGGVDDQTPFIRYRFLSVLQQIAESREPQFIDLSRRIIVSPSVRLYFKFSVPEIAGQQGTPSAELLEFIYSLFILDEWHDAVLQRVYFGHLPYIKHLDKKGYFQNLSDEGLNLLRSVYPLSPDYVISIIERYTAKNSEDANRIYQVLSYNLSYDTPKAQKFRLKLLEQYPVLYCSPIGLSQLAQEKPPLLIPFLKSIVLHSEEIDQQLYLGEKKLYQEYAESYYRETVESLLPVVGEVTARFSASSRSIHIDDPLEKWIDNKSNRHFERIIVEMLKAAIEHYYNNDPDNCKKIISDYEEQQTVILNEIFSYAVLSMDIADSDFAIRWLCEDPHNRMFIYTARQDDYLALTKEIIKKHSPNCSSELFAQLEEIVVSWKEPVDQMILLYQFRFDSNHRHTLSYLSYWGMLQKELLPQMESSRLSTASKELLRVLDRNMWVSVPFYHYPILPLGVGGVSSPVDQKLSMIRDKTWLKIISMPDYEMNNHFHKDRISGNYIHTTHRAFADSLSSQAQKEPERFAKLALQFPDNCNEDYIIGVLNAIDYPAEGVQLVSTDCVCSLIKHFKGSVNDQIVKEIMNIISKYADYDWPDEIIDYICDTALQTTPKRTELHRKLENNEDTESTESLYVDVINSVTGCSIRTMSKLLEAHPNLSEKFLPVMDELSQKDNDIIRYALMFCVFSAFEIDPNFALSLFRFLLSQDMRILGFQSVWELILEDREQNASFYVEQLKTAVNSNIKGLAEEAAGMLCAFTIFFDTSLQQVVCRDHYTQKQVEEICHQAISSLEKEEFHVISRDILLYMVNNYDVKINSLAQLFSNNRLEIYRDKEFLIELMASKHADGIAQEFLDYIKSQEQDVTLYLDIIHQLSKNAMIASNSWRAGSVIDKITSILLKILERNTDNRNIKCECLDIWDNIYLRWFDRIKPLTKWLDTDE